MKKTITLTESELKGLITKILNETRLDYDMDNFSGKLTKNPPENYIDPEGSLDSPNAGDPFGDYRDEIVNDYNGDEKAAENDYSWSLNQGDYPSIDPSYRTNRNGVNRDIDNIHTLHNSGKGWSSKQLRSADRMKDKWIKGERGFDDIDDAFYGSSLDEAITRAIKKVLKEETDMYSEVNLMLSQLGDVKVSPFYSDEDTVTVSAPEYVNTNEIVKIMRRFGYDYYDSGLNGNRKMIEFHDTDWHPQANL